MIRSTLAEICGPLAALRNILQDRQLDAGGRRIQANRCAGQKLLDAVEADPLRCADQSNRRVQFARKRRNIHLAAATLQVVRHVQQNERGQSQIEYWCRQYQVTP